MRSSGMTGGIKRFKVRGYERRYKEVNRVHGYLSISVKFAPHFFSTHWEIFVILINYQMEISSAGILPPPSSQ